MASTLRTVCDSFKIRRCTVPETKPTNMCTWEIFKVVFNASPSTKMTFHELPCTLNDEF